MNPYELPSAARQLDRIERNVNGTKLALAFTGRVNALHHRVDDVWAHLIADADTATAVAAAATNKPDAAGAGG